MKLRARPAFPRPAVSLDPCPVPVSLWSWGFYLNRQSDSRTWQKRHLKEDGGLPQCEAQTPGLPGSWLGSSIPPPSLYCPKGRGKPDQSPKAVYGTAIAVHGGDLSAVRPWPRS